MEFYPLHTAEYATVILASDWLYFSRHGLKGGTKRHFLSNVCEFGTVGKISDYQPEGFGFNHQSGRRLNFRRSFATLSWAGTLSRWPIKFLNALSGVYREPTHLSIIVS